MPKKPFSLPEPPTGAAFRALREEIRLEPDYAWSWHCNFAMPIKDRTSCTHLKANEAAADLMFHIFAVDTRKHPNFPKTEKG